MTSQRLRTGLRIAVLAAFAATMLALARLEAQVSTSFERERMKAVLDTVSRQVERNFYDETLRGLDWKAKVAEARQRIEQSTMAGEMITAIFALLYQLNDSHTVFIPPARRAKIRFGFNAKAYGDCVMVYEVLERSAAARAGLLPGDRIISINGYSTERDGFDLLMVFFRRLRPVDRMDIVYSRQGGPPQRVLIEAEVNQGVQIENLTDLNTIYKYVREAERDKEIYRYGSYEGNIGLLEIPEFSADQSILTRLAGRVQDSRAMIVDLRGNPGGAVDSLREFAGFFEAEPVVMAEIVERKKSNPIRVRPRKPHLAGPMFVLVDSQSSSAAEMFARHFQRTGRAVVIGDRTSGRVTASKIFSESVGADIAILFGVQVAVGRVVFPGGEELEGQGVTPDRLCIPTGEQLREGRDPCRSLALALAREALGLPPKVEITLPAPKPEGP